MPDRDTTPTVELDDEDLAALVGDLDDPDDSGDLIATDLEIVEGATPFDAAIRLAVATDEGQVAMLLPLRPTVIRALHTSLGDLYRDQQAALNSSDLTAKPTDLTDTADPVLSNNTTQRPRPRNRSRSTGADNADDQNGDEQQSDQGSAARDPSLGSRLNPLGGAMRQVVNSKKATAAAALILAALLLCWLIWLIAT